MSRSHRNWPGGILRCSRCKKEFKQAASLASHTRVCPGAPPKPKRKRYRYPKHFREYLARQGHPDATCNSS